MKNKITYVTLFILASATTVSANDINPQLKYKCAGTFKDWTEEAYYSSPYVGDIDGDGKKEIVFSNYSITVLDAATGNTKWKVNSGHDRNDPVQEFNASNGHTWSDVEVADINGDGALEIITAHGHGVISVLDSNGYFLPGWPQTPQGQSYPASYLYGVFMDNITTGDLNNDGILEIIVPSDLSHIAVFEPDGSSFPANHDVFGNKNWGHIALFEDYSANEMIDILKMFAGKGYTLQDDYIENTKKVFEFWETHKNADFGNGRDVRKYFEACKSALYLRLEKKYPDFNIPEEEKTTFTGDDVPEVYRSLLAKKTDTVQFVPIAEKSIATEYPTPFDYETNFNRTLNALLFIKAKMGTGVGYGSGFILTSDGYAVTCNHVIDNASELAVRVRIPGRIGGDDTWHKAIVVKADKELDIALLKLEGSNFPQMPVLARNEMSHIGDDIVLAGYPFGAKLSDSEDKLNHSIFEGKIASTQIQRGYEKQFVDMQAKRGNSGGPVIDRETGLVVGILCGSQTEGDSRLVEEINYIPPIKYIWETFAEEIK